LTVDGSIELYTSKLKRPIKMPACKVLSMRALYGGVYAKMFGIGQQVSVRNFLLAGNPA